MAAVLLLTGAACAGNPSAASGPGGSAHLGGTFPGDVPPGQVRWGASIHGNGDPARHELPSGRAMALRRTFFQWHQRTGSMVSTARADVAAGRLPWVSVKPPSWNLTASGAVDAEIDSMLRALDSVGGPVWLTVHHEPEGGGGVGSADDPGGPTAWRAMQAHVRSRMQAVGTRNVALASILMAWTFDPRSRRDPGEWFVPGVFDLAGIDYYVEDESMTDLSQGRQWRAARDFYGRVGLPVAIGEWGNRGTDEAAAAEMEAFHAHARGSAWDGAGARVVGMSYFDSNLNSSTGGWMLTGAPLDRFRALMGAVGTASL